MCQSRGLSRIRCSKTSATFCVIEATKQLRLLRMLPRAMRGKHTKTRGVTCHRDTRAELESERPCHGHADGELLGDAIVRVEIEILPGLLPLVC